jgi:predicted transcriptional regulator
MQVMHGKGLLSRDESQRSHVYAAAQEQDALQTNLLSDLIQKAFAGSGKRLVLAALSGHVTDAERDEIRRLLDASAPDATTPEPTDE